MENVVGIWGMAQSTTNATLITACLTLLSTDISRLLKLKLNIDHLKEVLQLPSLKDMGGEHQLRLAATWMDNEVATADQLTPVDQLDSLLPLVDLKSITETSLLSFMCEKHAIVRNDQCR